MKKSKRKLKSHPDEDKKIIKQLSKILNMPKQIKKATKTKKHKLSVNTSSGLTMSGKHTFWRILPKKEFKPTINWPDPTQDMLKTPEFEAIWECIKDWDINVPKAYEGYTTATGNHARAIIDALKKKLVFDILLREQDPK